MEVKTFGVIGSGQMGNGIAQVAAAAGLNVIMNDIKEAFCEKGMATIAGSLGRLVKRKKYPKMTKRPSWAGSRQL